MKFPTAFSKFHTVRNLLASLLLAALLASCAGIIGPRQIEVPLAKLQQGLDRRFPVNKRMLELFEVQLTRPQLTVLPDTDRIALSMDASIAPPFSRRSWNGSFGLSGRLTLDPGRHAVLLSDAQVDRFAIDGVDEERQRQFTRVAKVLMDNVVRDIPLYSFREEELRYAGVQFVPTRITTTPQGLLVTLEPR